MDRTDTHEPELPQHDGADGGQPVDGAKEAGSGEGSRLYKEIVEWIKALAIAGLLVFVIRWFLFAPFIVDGPSMQPNFETGERLIVNKILYDFREPRRGEVIVFHVPEENRDFIKRVIGVPGDTVRLEGDELYINGVKFEEPYLREAIERARAAGEPAWNLGDDFPNAIVSETTVPEGMILAFGDNRRNSKDSRMIGFIPLENVIGRADVVFWPLDKFGFIDHSAPVPAG
ncbi:MAG: signal peptidase I [Thermobacillus sp. ZCTH02-B1]|uniref:signal peptidase I n=1 Tax=Thermobacillus sp. ZCTH02-B1 TaxID=1858795 RepID=UPI000B55DE7C|nr:signal peptidase I [Thermobacillus sp. ZCTH02-B1]OUM96384.1 MAG: signal peptidase I [Thermobacillus sp. ZCTH02-B1]